MAAADRDDQHNRACTDLFTGLHLARRAILVPAPVVAEVGYLLGRAGGAKVEAAFLRSIVQENLTIVDLELADYERIAELVEIYADFPLGTTDAAVVAVAERLGSTRSSRWIVATSDQDRALEVVIASPRRWAATSPTGTRAAPTTQMVATVRVNVSRSRESGAAVTVVNA
ncbi:type II toxin-antitoxin system VapC family toxin [Pseudonocardia charpentierae]|uniref:PIN domain-containing protein n=1 Tax=Pseudonocardia charpentierae TaxID=3075545 RepID=A0ABU2NIS1_9PSEU|nr:PIN domain-containing protein [Pseudonocardia sp. DSM 45834]MDT0353872.1 PIN domain-containing protein [Pseudonocardia sp. DSM 45834]